MGTISKYVPLLLVIVFVAGAILIEHSIINARHLGNGEGAWMFYGLEGFVFALLAIGIFVIGATHRELGVWGWESHLLSQTSGEKTWTSF
jgi:hypothetical protein